MNRKTIIAFIFLFILPFAFLFLKSNNFFVLHDGIYHLQRTFNFYENIREGNFPVRWSTRLNNNFGSPIFIFLFPVPYIISSFVFFLTNNLVLSYKISNILFIAIFGVGCYRLIKSIFKDSKAALFGSALAIFTPYYLVQILVRGAYREMAAMSLFPWVLIFLEILLRKNNLLAILNFALVFSLCFLSDALTMFTMIPFLSFFLLYLFLASCERRKTCVGLFLSMLIFLGLGSFILLPYFFESKYIDPNLVANFWSNHFVLFKNIFSLKWGFGFSEKWFSDRMPLQFGVLQILITLSSFAIFFKEKQKRIVILIGVSLVNITFVALLSTENFISVYIWEKIYFIKVLQFPWRFYSSLPLTFAICGAFVFSKIDFSKINKFAAAILICLPLILSFKYLKTNQIVVIEEKQIVEHQGEASAFNEFIPRTRNTTSTFSDVKKRYEIISGKMQIKNYQQKSAGIDFSAVVKIPGILQINELYFPGWEIYDNGARLTKDLDYQITTANEKIRTENKDDSGLFRIYLKKGEHKIWMNFEETPVRRFGDLISLISMTMILGLYIMIICFYN